MRYHYKFKVESSIKLSDKRSHRIVYCVHSCRYKITIKGHVSCEGISIFLVDSVCVHKKLKTRFYLLNFTVVV